MPDTAQLLERLTLSLAIGLLIGVERGWQERAEKPGLRAAGVRTFALLGLLGGLAAVLQPSAGAGFLAVALAVCAAGLGLFEWREAQLGGTASATGFVAGVVTVLLGAFAMSGNAAVAGMAAIAVTVLLAERRLLHAFVARLTPKEVRAALLLLAMTFVLLPMLPDRTVDPWQALNPRQLWLMMIVIAAVSYVGYIGLRLSGERTGLVLAAMAGGLVSSTAVTLAYAQLSRRQPDRADALAAGVASSWTVSLLRMGIIAVAVAPPLLVPLAAALGPAALATGVSAALLYRRAGIHRGEAAPRMLSDPFELSQVLKFGVLLAAVNLISKWSHIGSNTLALLPLAAVTGFVDVDPITLSVARSVGAGMTVGHGVDAMLVAAAANLLCKCLIAAIFGARPLAISLAGTATAAALASAGLAAGMGWMP